MKPLLIFLFGPLALPLLLLGKPKPITVPEASLYVQQVKAQLGMETVAIEVVEYTALDEKVFKRYLAFVDGAGVYQIHVSRRVLRAGWKKLRLVMQHEVLHVRYDADVLNSWDALGQNDREHRHERIAGCIAKKLVGCARH